MLNIPNGQHRIVGPIKLAYAQLDFPLLEVYIEQFTGV